MSKNKTLIIVGAGASSEVGLPTGEELKSKIVKLLNIRLDDVWDKNLEGGDRVIWQACCTIAKEQQISLGSYKEAAWKIRDAMPLMDSIDDFIDKHSDDKLIEICGKLAIVRSILDAEKNSKLYFKNSGYDASIDYATIQNTWFTKFYKALTEGCSREDLAERFESIVMVIFNYDRCVEHFLFNSIKRSYPPIDDAEATDLMSRIEIYHPYGKVGHLPWQKREGSIAFGAESGVDILLNMSKQIRTFTEGTDPSSSDISFIREHVNYSELIIFLGFAFHKLNLELLAPPSSGDGFTGSSTKCFATAKDISEHDCAIIIKELKKLKPMMAKNIFLGNKLKCVDLFEKYRRSLSFT